MSIQILRSSSLSTIPPRKIVDALEFTVQSCEFCGPYQKKLNAACPRCRTLNTAIQRYAESNIPVDYWKLELDNFQGSPELLEQYQLLTADLQETYKQGKCLCFAGPHGIGKTTVLANVLKRAVEKGYTAQYVNLNDIVTALINSEDRAIARKCLVTVDFLVIDEFDPRHIGSEQAADLFGRILEDIFRTRVQNQVPIFMCTNSPHVEKMFKGPMQQSISSLMNYVEVIPMVGKDFRPNRKVKKV